jgi:hypothetical protein
MQAEESVGTVRALKQILQDHRRRFGIKLTEPATNLLALAKLPKSRVFGKLPLPKSLVFGKVLDDHLVHG